MAKVRKIKNRTKKGFLKLGGNVWLLILKIIVVIVLFAGVVTGLYFLDRFVPKPKNIAIVKLVDPPIWINEALKDKIYAAARVDKKSLKIDEELARRVQQNVERNIIWLYDVRTQTTSDSLLISAKWRKPIGMVTHGDKNFYVDEKQTVLDYVPVEMLPIVSISGLSTAKKIPPAGQIWQQEDLAAAITILNKLNMMDRDITPTKPLLAKIDHIDVSNFKGRANNKAPHIIFYTKDNTQIIWGAEFGTWQRYLEASDEEKIAKLYTYYEESGFALKGAQYINLCEPRDKLPRPTDKY